MTYEEWKNLPEADKLTLPESEYPTIPSEQLRNFLTKAVVKKVKGVLYEGCRITEVYRKNRYAYGMRHPDDDMSVPATICPRSPMVNFFGTFVTKELLPITEEAEIIGWEEVK